LWKGDAGAQACAGDGSGHVLAAPRRSRARVRPEEVYVVAGTFNDGARDCPAGTFLNAPAGSWHVPATATGCTPFLFYPAG